MIADQELAKRFLASGQTLALAESCTGGMIAARITDLPGCSAWFRGGVIAYHNEIKQQVLGVPADLLEQHGAVSEAVAQAMAEGVRKLADSELALSVTGIAGPDGGSPEKPVGTVYISLVDISGCVTRCYHFKGNRDAVRKQTTEEALFMLKMRISQPECA